ncbi:MAG TPA: response regulator transcription factor [Saprospiraceae bacterium]|nr:response regulator transcription factor [Saprospiraceae bacterium]HND88040.1 response regulator transcription factor [Saprospiraceae bacterium]
MIRLLLADDHQLVRKGFRALLEELDFVEVVAEAANGREVLQLLRNGARADVALLDYEMPLMNGLEAAEQIGREFMGMKVIILTMLQSKELVQEAIEKGVKGFLFKDTSPEELGEAIRRVAGGGSYFSSEVTRTLARPASNADAQLLEQLSEREREVLRMVAQGMNSREIGQRLFISPRTVDTHRNNMLQKLGVNGIAGLTQFALRNKLC